jgi:hypothetical protein
MTAGEVDTPTPSSQDRRRRTNRPTGGLNPVDQTGRLTTADFVGAHTPTGTGEPELANRS